MNSLGLCFCGSEILFQNCCQKYINGTQNAPTALDLMRSRYSAYVIHQADYLLSTTHVSQRHFYSKTDILNWATANEWRKLEIISYTENTVKFKAYFLDNNKIIQIHQEYSTFKKEDGSWFYLDGRFE